MAGLNALPVESRAFTGDGVAERIIAGVLRRYGWSPLEKRLWVAIDDSPETELAGVTVSGVIRGYDQSPLGAVTRLLVELDRPLNYVGCNSQRQCLRWLVTEPCLRRRRTSRLFLFSWSVARIVDAPSFVDSTHEKTIGIARLQLASSRRVL